MFKLILGEYAQYVHHHPLKHCGLPVVLAPLLIYSDDTSGNRFTKRKKIDLRPESLKTFILLPVQTNSLQLK